MFFMKAFISGTVVSVYERDSKDREGKPIKISCADVYCGHEVFRLAKIDKSITVGKNLDKIPVNIYWNQYGTSVVYDNTAF